MAEHEFLALLSEKVLDGAEVKMDDILKDIEEWDSLSIVAFLAMINIAIDKSINPLDARKALTVRDLYELTV
jgi:acyl carrier protein